MVGCVRAVNLLQTVASSSLGEWIVIVTSGEWTMAVWIRGEDRRTLGSFTLHCWIEFLTWT